MSSMKDKLVNKPLYDPARISNIGRTPDQKDYAQIRDFFFYQNTPIIQQVLQNDLLNYMDGADIKRIKYITTDFFVPAFLKKLCNVYDTPPLFKSNEEIPEEFTALMEEADILPFLSDTFEKMRFHNTVLASAKYNDRLDRIILENHYNIGNSFVYTYPDYNGEWQALAYLHNTVKNFNHFVCWDRETNEHYIIKTKEATPDFNEEKDSLRFVGDYFFINGNEDYSAPDYGMPFTTYRYYFDGMNFFGNGMDSIVELVRTINVLLTVMTDDTVQESIRLLILNFNPTGTQGEKGQLKTGLRHPLFVEDRLGASADPTGSIVSADLYNEEILKLVEGLTDMLSSLHNIDNVLKANLDQSLSGIALKLKTEPMLRQWANDINKVRKNDLEFIKKVVAVNNYHRPDKQIPEAFLDSLVLDYQEPSIVTNEQEDYNLEKQKWEDGVSSPVQYLMKRNPEKSENQIKEEIQKNLTDTSEMIDTGNAFQIEPVNLEDEVNA